MVYDYKVASSACTAVCRLYAEEREFWPGRPARPGIYPAFVIVVSLVCSSGLTS